MYTLDELIESYKKYLTLYSNEIIIPVKKHLRPIIEEYIKEIKALLDKTFEYDDLGYNQ